MSTKKDVPQKHHFYVMCKKISSHSVIGSLPQSNCINCDQFITLIKIEKKITHQQGRSYPHTIHVS